MRNLIYIVAVILIIVGNRIFAFQVGWFIHLLLVIAVIVIVILKQLNTIINISPL
jgi:hypothetical protein